MYIFDELFPPTHRYPWIQELPQRGHWRRFAIGDCYRSVPIPPFPDKIKFPVTLETSHIIEPADIITNQPMTRLIEGVFNYEVQKKPVIIDAYANQISSNKLTSQ